MKDNLSELQHPPSTYQLQEAIKHRAATSLGKPYEPIQKCSCCNRQVNKEPLSLCFEDSQTFHSGTEYSSYLIMLRSFLLQFVLMGLVFAVPLLFLNYKSDGCGSILLCGNNFLYSFSIFNSFNSQSNLNMLFYLTIPVVLLSLILFLFTTRSLCLLRIKQQELGLFPDSCALFLQLPFNHLTDEFIIGHIDGWWQKEANKNGQYFASQFPELNDKNIQADNLLSESSEAANRIQSPFVHQVIFSYNYPEFQAFRNEIQVFTLYFQNEAMVNKQEMTALMNLHERKRKMLHDTAKNKFCIIIFKSPKYAHYFYRKTHTTRCEKMFCYQQKRQLEIEGERVEVERGHYPSELYWQNMHLTFGQRVCRRMLSFLLFLFLFGGSSGGWYGVYLIHSDLINNNSSFLQYFPIVVAATANLLVILINMLIKFVSGKQQRKTYAEQALSYIIKTSLININILYLSPLVVYSVIDYTLLWKNNGLMLLTYYLFGIYAALSLILKYISRDSIAYWYNQIVLDQSQQITQKQANQKYQKPSFEICQNIAHLITMMMLTCLILPLNPLIAAISLLWAALFYLTQKINMSSFCKQNQNHGHNLILSACHFAQLAPLLLIASCLGTAVIASLQGVLSLSILIICILSVSAFICLLYLFLPIQQFWEARCDSPKLKQLEYYELKSGCLSLYQKYNNPYLYGVKASGQQKEEYSVRLKIFEQMNTMSKTLTQSLKQRLLSRQNPVLNNQFKKQDDENEVDNIYFEYQKKVNMKSSTPKIEIPRLFKAQAHEWNNSAQLSQSDRVNINSLFSSEDEDQKKLVKKLIKQRVKQEGKIR